MTQHVGARARPPPVPCTGRRAGLGLTSFMELRIRFVYRSVSSLLATKLSHGSSLERKPSLVSTAPRFGRQKSTSAIAGTAFSAIQARSWHATGEGPAAPCCRASHDPLEASNPIRSLCGGSYKGHAWHWGGAPRLTVWIEHVRTIWCTWTVQTPALPLTETPGHQDGAPHPI